MNSTATTSLTLVSALALLLAACGEEASGGGGGAGGGSGGASTTAASTTASSTTTATGTGGAGGGEGGAAPLTCTEDAPPSASCLMGPTPEPCTVELDGGCPTTTVTWACENGEGGMGWLKRSDSHCDCAGDGTEEASCTALPGCVWATPSDACEAMEFGERVPEQGCYRSGCGFASWGEGPNGTCHSDLCVP